MVGVNSRMYLNLRPLQESMFRNLIELVQRSSSDVLPKALKLENSHLKLDVSYGEQHHGSAAAQGLNQEDTCNPWDEPRTAS